VNAGKREKSERGGKPKEWEREGEEEAGVARKSIRKARDVEGSIQEVREERSMDQQQAW
jgi:hypothetical protein